MHRLVRRLVLLPSIAIALLIPAVAPAGALAARDFPAGWKGFHTYPEMVADIQAVAAAHPGIVHLFSIGTSYQGRELWAAKVSDNVGTDENEPEVLFDGLHHSDEHMGLEMTLHILHWLDRRLRVELADHLDRRLARDLDRVRDEPRRRRSSTSRAATSTSGARTASRRRARAPSGPTSTGTTATAGAWAAGPASNPEAITYHGPAPFSAPETRAMRDFLASRVVGGRQQIRVAITFHEAGRLVMWPYGYTKKNVPPDMTSLDHLALRDDRPPHGEDQRLQARAGQRPVHHPRGVAGLPVRHVPDLRVHVRDVEPGLPEDAADRARDRAQQGGRPVAGRASLVPAVRPRRLGPRRRTAARSTTTSRSAAAGPSTRTAPTRRPRPAVSPAATRRHLDRAATSQLQPSTVPSGSGGVRDRAGRRARRPARTTSTALTTIRSTPITLPVGRGPAARVPLAASRTPRTSSSADHLRAIVEDGRHPDGRAGSDRLAPAARRARWRTASRCRMDAWAGHTIRIRFEALDGGPDSTVEAGIDDVHVSRPTN